MGHARGWVDEAWAKEHHAYWYEDIKAGKIPAERSKPLTIANEGADAARPA
jgi:formate dehydrogenase subunit gamma